MTIYGSYTHEKRVDLDGSHETCIAFFPESELALQFRPATDHDVPARFCRLLPWRKDRIFADLPTAPRFGPLAPELYFTGCAVAHTSPYLVAGAHRRFPSALRGSMAEQCADLDDSLLVHQQLL